MFIGHYAVGIAGRAARADGPSLAVWFLAVQWLDLVWPVLVLLGVEHVRVAPGHTAFTPLHFVDYPYTHSALAALLWALAFAAVYRWRTGDARSALWLGGGVFSHWVLDWITHAPDLPLYPGGPLLGLGLWNSVPGTLLVEGAAFLAAIVLYTRTTQARSRAGHGWWWGLLAFLSLTYVANMLSPPPPSGTAVAASALALWLLVPWGAAIERGRMRRA